MVSCCFIFNIRIQYCHFRFYSNMIIAKNVQMPEKDLNQCLTIQSARKFRMCFLFFFYFFFYVSLDLDT